MIHLTNGPQKMEARLRSGEYVCIECNRNKQPIMPNWPNCEERKAPVSQFYAILCGEKNNLLVVDCDIVKPKDGDNCVSGVDAWELLKTQLGSELSTLKIPTVETPSGGRHLYFRWDPDLRNISSVQKLCPENFGLSTEKIVKIDILSDRRCVVGPGSPGYRFVDDSGLNDPPALPSILKMILQVNRGEKNPQNIGIPENRKVIMAEILTMILYTI